MNGKGEDVEQSSAPEMARLVSAAKEGLPLVMFDKDGVRAIENVLYNGRSGERVEKPAAVRKIAEQEGFHIGKARVAKPAPGFKHTLGARVISTSRELANRDPNEITAAGFDARDVRLVDLARLATELKDL
jgi:hypothetical protein